MTRPCLTSVILAAMLSPAALAQEDRAVDARADAVLRQTSAYLRGLDSFRVEISVHVDVKMEGMTQQMDSKYRLAARRPNRFAMVLEQGMFGATVVSDGQKLYTYMPMMKKYTVKDAPRTTEEIGTPEGVIGGMGSMTGNLGIHNVLLAADPYGKVMEGVKALQFLGTEDLEGSATHHLRFVQDVVQWDLWLANQENPLPRKVTCDLTEMVAAAQKAMPGANAMSMELQVEFANWRVNEELPDEVFAFAPPDGVEETESFFAGMNAEQNAHALLGQAAPPFELPLLDGRTVKLAEHIGTHVVILDFWATWCGPCVRALPILAEVAKKYEDRDVLFYAVNQREEAETIRNFLKRKDLELTVALDGDGSIGSAYGVEGIPQTVLIGKDGKVQAVHVGFQSGLRATLERELDALLAGKDLAAEAAAREEESRDGEGLERVWSINGPYRAVACGQRAGRAYGLSMRGNCIEVDETGHIHRDLTFKGQATVLRTANLIGDAQPEFLTFSAWGASVNAYDGGGNALWTYTEGQGVDDVWSHDLDGDGLDEVIVGYNGMTGLHVLDNQGRPLWKNTSLANVWHVCAGDVSGNGMSEVVTTSARGQLHVFDAQGGKLKDVQVSCYANMVRVAALAAGGHAIVVGGSNEKEETLVRIDLAGKESWSTNLGKAQANHIQSAHAAVSRPWLAVGLRGGIVQIVDVTDGAIIATLTGQGTIPEVAWLPQEGESPLLLVATGRALSAFNVVTPNQSE